MILSGIIELLIFIFLKRVKYDEIFETPHYINHDNKMDRDREFELMGEDLAPTYMR